MTRDLIRVKIRRGKPCSLGSSGGQRLTASKAAKEANTIEKTQTGALPPAIPDFSAAFTQAANLLGWQARLVLMTCRS